MSKITCRVCGKWEGHIIAGHLKEKHPKLSVFEYLTKYDGAEVASKAGMEALRRNHVLHLPTRNKVERPVHKIFGLKPAKGDDARRFVDLELAIFEEADPTTPAVDEDYIFNEAVLKRCLLALALPKRNRAWIHGYAGTGKTEIVKQVAARTNYGFSRIQGDPNISRRQIIGDWIAKDGETIFQYGILPRAMRDGHLLLIDEIDTLNPHTLTILRSVLEDPSTLVVLENGGERIEAHPDFRVFATANSAGAGDDTGLFVTSRALSVADRQRFAIWARMDYLPAPVETAMLKRRFPDLTDYEIRRFHQVVRAVREKHMQGEVEESFSPRELVNWAEKFVLTGDVMEAAAMCFLDRYASPAVALSVAELVRAAFDEHSTPESIPGE